MSEREKRHIFLGRCDTCLDNAYSDHKPCRIGSGQGQPLNDSECTIRTFLANFTLKETKP